MSQLKLPELGEGIEVVDVSAVLVGEGDFVRRDQPVIEVETEKASLEVPSDEDGQVVKLMVKAGDQLKVGQAILEVEAGKADDGKADDGKADDGKADDGKADDGGAKAKREGDAESEAKAEAREAAEDDRKAESGDEATKTEKSEAAPAAESTKEKAEARADADDADADADDAKQEDAKAEETADSAAAAASRRTAAEERATAGKVRDPASIGPTAPAAPSSRALARELGVDINAVTGTGPGGRISRDDVKAHAKKLLQGAPGAAAGVATPPLPDFSQWGEVRREPLTNVRRATAKGMATAWSTVPHVTQFDEADITQLESMRKRFNQRPEAAERKLTMTAIVIKMVGSALRQFPKFNASLDLAGDAVVYKDYVHVGCAVDTDRGLLVPVLQDVDKKNLVQVAVELNDLATRARAKKLKPDEMRGATFTVSNLGGLGTTHFSPIVNWPEVAILGVGRAKQQAIFAEGQFQPRLVMPLSLSYDHRLIDGADAARFLRRLAESLEQPLLLLLDD